MLAHDALGDAAGRGERVPTTRLLVTRHERLIVGLEEQHPVGDATRPEVIENLGQTTEVAAAAHVRDDRGPGDLRAGVHEQLDERPDHLRGQVVDAEIPLVLECGHRGRLAGAREPGDDHQVGQRRTWL